MNGRRNLMIPQDGSVVVCDGRRVLLPRVAELSRLGACPSQNLRTIGAGAATAGSPKT